MKNVGSAAPRWVPGPDPRLAGGRGSPEAPGSDVETRPLPRAGRAPERLLHEPARRATGLASRPRGPSSGGKPPASPGTAGQGHRRQPPQRPGEQEDAEPVPKGWENGREGW